MIFECPEKLLKLFERMPGIDVLFPQGKEPPEHDVHAALMSLPGLLGTTLETVPAEVPYIHPDPSWSSTGGASWRRIPSSRSGSTGRGTPGTRATSTARCPLRHFAPLARVPGVRLFSLQKNAGAEQLKELGERVPGGRPGEPARRGDASGPVPGHGGGDEEPRPVRHLGHGGGPPGRCAGGAGLGAAVDVAGLAVDARAARTARGIRRCGSSARRGCCDWPPVFERMAAALRALVPPTTIGPGRGDRGGRRGS